MAKPEIVDVSFEKVLPVDRLPVGTREKAQGLVQLARDSGLSDMRDTVLILGPQTDENDRRLAVRRMIAVGVQFLALGFQEKVVVPLGQVERRIGPIRLENSLESTLRRGKFTSDECIGKAIGCFDTLLDLKVRGII